jgi:hypothetical protein
MPTAKDAEATLKYTITGLVSPKAIQKTCINGGYIYVLQRSDTTTYFSRCKIDGTTASYVDHMVLSNFGHTQTLEHYTHKKKDYFLIGCKASTADKTNWALQIGRIQYVAGRTVQYTSICRLSSLRCANKSGSSFGVLRRADAALSSNNERLVVWAQNESYDVRYSIYDFKKINNVLDTKINESSKYVSCANSSVKNACISARTETKSGGNRFLPHGSMQGIELSDNDSIYIIGGNSSQIPEIGKMSSTGGNRALRKCTHPNFGASHNSEAEGVQLKGDYVYFGVYNSNIPKSKAGRWRIYSIPKTAF